MKADKPTQDGNHGERDRERDRAVHRYVREFVASGEVEPVTRDADPRIELAPEPPPPPPDRRAERKARRGPPPTKVPLDELVAKGHTVIDRVQLLMRRIARRFGRR
jgi:hypothetical protein